MLAFAPAVQYWTFVCLSGAWRSRCPRKSVCEWCLEAQRHGATQAAVEKWLGKKAGSLNVRKTVEDESPSELLCFCRELGRAKDIQSYNWRDSSEGEGALHV